MAGTIGGFGLQVQFDLSGNLARGALFYVYAANTTTPAITYSDSGLTTQQAWPLTADGSGRLPMFWVADGDYRARLTTSAGIEIFDEQSITAIGTSSSGTGSASQDTTTLIQTGYPIWLPTTGTQSGFVRANGLTIGSGSSSGTERANSDCQSLFEFLWNNLSDTICPVSSGRGSSGTADFNANKTITLLDLRGRALIGLDDMGNSAASRITAGTPTALSSGGAEKQTIAQANLPAVSLVTSSIVGNVGTSLTNGTAIIRVGSANSHTSGTSSGGSFNAYDGTTVGDTVSLASGSVSFSGNVPLGGSGTALKTTPPYFLGSWYIKL